MDERPSELLRYATVRVLASKTPDKNWSSVGTGFFYFIELPNNLKRLVLITNKHVIADAKAISFNFHESVDLDNSSPKKGSGREAWVVREDIRIALHPDKDVDLVAIDMGILYNYLKNAEKWVPYFRAFTEADIVSTAIISEMSSVEDVLMVGYPSGVFDAFNNFPAVRRGITSTPYASDYLGQREFLADIAVYGGSSGSPVILLNQGSYSTPSGWSIGTRFALLGILHAGHKTTVEGEIVSVPVPTGLTVVAKTDHMINLGLCIKADCLTDLHAEMMSWP